MVKFTVSSLLAATSLASVALAHPGEHEHHDHDAIAKQEQYANMVKRGLAACETHPNYLALKERAMQRRWEKAQHLRKKRGIALDAPINARFRRRDLTALEADEKVNHNKTSSGYTESTSSSTLFASYKNSSCILAPEVTFGPYWVEGEYYRSNVRDGQAGVPIHLEYQYIDVNTCDTPTSDLYIEHWSANATGVYSGVVASGNGNSNDLTNLNKTFLRGVTKVTDGVGAFDAIFPGHYEGRATHIHLITHIGGTVYSNNTYKGSNVAHVGQLFFDEELKTAVEKTSPYSTNTQAYTSNDEDMWAPYEAENGYDPFPDWAYLSNDISDGLLMWISVGVNMSASYTVTPAATLTANGGVADSDNAVGAGSGSAGNSTGGGSAPSGMGGTAGGSAPSGGAGGSGAPPSGSIPTGQGGAPGTATTTTASTKKSSSTTTKKTSTTTKKASTTTTKKSTTTTKKSTTTAKNGKSTTTTAKAGKANSTTTTVKKNPTTTTTAKHTSTHTTSPTKKHTTTTTKKHTTTTTKKHTSTTTHKPSTATTTTKHH